jgi:hypothetical protein
VAYLLIAAPENSERYGDVMELLMLLSLGMQIIAQFGAYFDDFLAYMDMAGRLLRTSTRPTSNTSSSFSLIRASV